jgi:hypothetical protein
MTLTELSYYSRKMLPFGILGLLLILILFYSLKIVLYLNTPPPTVAQLPTTLFPGEKIKAPVIKTASSAAELKFTLDTIEGRPTTATLSAQIFVLPPTSTSFGFKEKIQLMAKTLGFDTDVTNYSLNDKNATFQDDNQQLAIDISNFNFHYQYDLQKNPDLFTNSEVPQEQEAVTKASDFLNQIGKYSPDFAQTTPSVSYFHYDPNTTQLVPQVTPDAMTNVVEVDFFRPDIDAVPAPLSTVSSKFPNSQNYVAMVFSNGEMKVIKAQVQYFEKSADQVGLYPLKSGDQAYADLQAGNAYVINGQPGQTNITIKKMFLAYYDPDIYQPYLQPVYVFIGDNDFVGYVSAVVNALLTK